MDLGKRMRREGLWVDCRQVDPRLPLERKENPFHSTVSGDCIEFVGAKRRRKKTRRPYKNVYRKKDDVIGGEKGRDIPERCA